MNILFRLETMNCRREEIAKIDYRIKLYQRILNLELNWQMKKNLCSRCARKVIGNENKTS
jgi:hypothetical protein